VSDDYDKELWIKFIKDLGGVLIVMFIASIICLIILKFIS